MAKRFCDTEIFKKKWFRVLPVKYKTLFFYLFTSCDLAGIWDVDFDQVSFFVDKTISEEKALQLFQKHILVIESGKKWLLKDFIPFQYGDNLNEKSPVHKKIIEILSKYKVGEHTLYHTLYNRVSDRVKEEDKDKEEDKVIVIAAGEKKDLVPEQTIENPKWNQKPGTAEMNLLLPDMKANAVIELFGISKKTKVSKADVQSLWGIFKQQNFCGEKYYSSDNQVFSHFINWCKTQDVNKIQAEASNSVVSHREQKAREILNL